MKEINHIFRATKKDGPLEKVLAKLPENPNGYSSIFTNFDKKFADRVLEGLSECDEDLHPAMFIPLSYIFLTTPAKAKEELDEPCAEGTLFDKFCREFLENAQQWLYWNADLVDKLLQLCHGIEKTPLSKTVNRIDNLYITPQIEKDFVQAAGKDNLLRIKHIKVLAAITALLVQAPLQKAIEKADAKLSAYFMFWFTRAMAQFSANRVVDIGLSSLRRSRKGGGVTEDRAGLQAFIKKYHDKYPTETNEKLWGIIKNVFQEKKFEKPLPGYSITFYEDSVNPDSKSGELIQKNANDDKHSIQYSAFTTMRGELR